MHAKELYSSEEIPVYLPLLTCQGHFCAALMSDLAIEMSGVTCAISIGCFVMMMLSNS